MLPLRAAPQDFNKGYAAGSDEWKAREALFTAELARVRAHNAKDASWRAGVNHLSDATEAEASRLNGLHKGLLRSQKFADAPPSLTKPQPLPASVSSVPLAALPKFVDWRQKGVVTAVKDQGHCGSCWAFASTGTIESHVAINTGILEDLSPQQLVSCAANPQHCGGTGGCQGSIPELAFDYVKANGQSSEWTMPYTSYSGASNGQCFYNATGATPAVAHVDGYVKLPSNNYTSMMQAVALVGPVAVNVWALPWKSYEGGVFSGCDFADNIDIDHVVILIGYGTDASTGQDYWLIRNSWSPRWGEQGTIRLARHANAQCGTDSSPSDGTGCDNGPSAVTVCGQCGVLYDGSYPTGATI